MASVVEFNEWENKSVELTFSDNSLNVIENQKIISHINIKYISDGEVIESTDVEVEHNKYVSIIDYVYVVDEYHIINDFDSESSWIQVTIVYESNERDSVSHEYNR